MEKLCLHDWLLIRGQNILFRVLTFAKPECDNVLQPDPRSGEGCNTLVHSGLANVNTRKRLLYCHCHIHVPSFLVQVFTIQSKNDLSEFLAEGFKVHKYTAARGGGGGASIPLQT